MKQLAIFLALIITAASLAIGTTAAFAQSPTFDLTVTQRQTAGTPVRIKSTPSGIDGFCVSACTRAFPSGAAVTLTVEGTNFAWEGACKGQTGACHLKMDAARNVVLDRSSASVKLTVTHGSVDGQGFGSVVGEPGGIVFSANPTSHTYEKGTVVTLTEYRPRPGVAKLNRWEGACAGQPTSPVSCRLVMDGDKSVHTMWEDANKTQGALELKIVSVGMPGAYQVTPPGKMVGDCRAGISTCVERYAVGTEITIVALGSSNYLFDRWEHCDTESRNTCKVKMTKNHTVTAHAIYTGR